jgi:CheY-like chemotaxis protein
MAGLILVLDDEERYAIMLRDLLKEHGFEAEVSIDPRDALDRVRDQHYDLVISDYKMPVIDGAEFLLKARKTNPSLPVIMVSGLMNMPELLKVANIGVTLVLEKPFNTEEFLKHVAKFVEPVTVEEPQSELEESANVPSASVVEESAADPMVWSYPRPSRFVADQSLDNKQLLQSLHEYYTTHRHILLECLPGLEIERLESEISSWKEAPQIIEHIRFNLHELQSEDVRKQMMEWFDKAAVIVVNVVGNEGDRELLADVISFIEDTNPGMVGPLFLYQLPLQWLADTGQLNLQGAVSGMVAPKILHLTPIYDRPADIVCYALRITRLEQAEGEGRVWTEPALALLLTHPWRNHFRELNACLLRCLAFSTDSGIIDETMVAKSLRLRPGEADLSTSGLERFLNLQQNRFLASLDLEPDALKEVLAAEGVPADAFDDALSLDKQPLFFPDLLGEHPAAAVERNS